MTAAIKEVGERIPVAVEPFLKRVMFEDKIIALESIIERTGKKTAKYAASVAETATKT